MRPWASGDRTNARCSRPGSARLPTNVLAPVVAAPSYTRRTAVPKIDPGMCPAYVCRVLSERDSERPTTDRKIIVVAEKQISTEVSPGPMPGGWQARVLERGIERALRTQQPLVSARIAAIRRKRPQASPAEVIESLGRSLKIAVSVTGGVGGAIAL